MEYKGSKGTKATKASWAARILGDKGDIGKKVTTPKLQGRQMLQDCRGKTINVQSLPT
jgi:hypothetical protein